MISFPTQQTLKTEVFARLPDKYRLTGRQSEWGNANRAGAELPCFLESPAFDRQGNLYLVDVPWGRVFRVSPDGVFDLAYEYEGWPYGLKFHRDGRIFIADYLHGIFTLDIALGKTTTVVARHLPASLKGANDLCFASNGDLYFTDYGQSDLRDATGRVFRLTNSGKLECLLDFVPGPNGLTLSPSEKVLYVAATRANAVWRTSLMPDGAAVKASVFVHLDGGVGPDGMTVDSEANVVVAHAGRGIVWIYTKHGELIYRIESCGSDELTNVAYGGADGKTLFITDAEGEILTARLPTAGHPLYSHQ